MSTLRVDNLESATGVGQYTAKAWVNFNGTGTVAIRASGNVSSITDNGVGQYVINLTSAVLDANYCGVSSYSFDNTIRTSGNNGECVVHPISASQISVQVTDGAFQDVQTASVAIFR